MEAQVAVAKIGKYATPESGDSLEMIEEVARAYDIRWLILERADAVPAPGSRSGGTPSDRVSSRRTK